MKFAKFDKELTRAAGFKDKRSKIGLRPDGSQLVRLAGADMSALHDEVFERDGWRCKDGSMGINHCDGPLELSHDIPRGKGGSDTAENTHCRCQKHHRLRDNREVKWSTNAT